ncbi:19593_t:CDS:2, partial [Gigaspora margarita]
PSQLQIELQTDVQIFESDLVINLNELLKRPKNEINAQVIHIYGDVVQLSDNLEIQMLMQSELIIKNGYKDPLKFKINSQNVVGVISLHNGEFKDISNFSIALFYNNPDVTRSILTWIIKINELKDKEENEFEMTKKLYYHALRMLDILIPSSKERIVDLMGFAKGYENEYKDFLKQDNVNKQRSKLAAQKELLFAILDLSLSVGKVVIQSGNVLSVVDAIEKVSKPVHVLENDINDKANKIKEITNDLKSSHAKAVELYKSVESLIKDAEYFNIKNISERQNIKGTEKYINSLADFINFVDAYIKAKIEAIERSEFNCSKNSHI